MPAEDASALPSRRARALAFLAILVAGTCGALIGYGVVDLQCRADDRRPSELVEDGGDGGDGDCDAASGVGAVVGGVAAAGGVAVVATLVLRAVGEAGRVGPARPGRADGPVRGRG